MFRQKLRVFLNTYNGERKSQQALFCVCVGQFQEEKKEARSLPSSFFFLLLSSSSSFVSVARSMHVFTPGASVVRFTEEETRSTFEPPPSRARKKNAVATASLFPTRERKKNTRRRPKEFKKSSNGFVVVRTRTKNDEQKSVPNNRCACARSARTLPPPLAVALIFETL